MVPQPTVLVIDDNPAVATALEVLFSLHDLRTISARSPDAALALLAREPVDLVIQDMNFSTDTTSGVVQERRPAESRRHRSTLLQVACPAQSRENGLLATRASQVAVDESVGRADRRARPLVQRPRHLSR